MAKRKKISKADINKLSKVAATLQNFAASANAAPADAGGPFISVTDTYTVGNSGNPVSFDLSFLTRGVGALTDASLHAANVPDKVLFTGSKDNISDSPLGNDSDLNGRILRLRTAVGATELTPIPSALNITFVLKGGTASKTIPIPDTQITSAGQAFVIDYTILIFQA